MICHTKKKKRKKERKKKRKKERKKERKRVRGRRNFIQRKKGLSNIEKDRRNGIQNKKMGRRVVI